MKDSPTTTTIPSRIKRIKNAICFFASEHERLTHKPLARTFLHKYLSFLDFAALEETGRPALGVLYRKIGKGAMSNDTHHGKRDMLKNESFVLVPEAGGRYVVKAVGKPDLECFSPFEVNVMRELVETYADQFAMASHIREGGRGRIGFQKQTQVKENAIANYAHVFDDSIANEKEVRAMSGLKMLTGKYVAQLEELETRLADVKHKLETVLEASRLLEEEGLSEDNPPPFGDKKTFP